MTLYSFLKRLCTDSGKNKIKNIDNIFENDLIDYTLTNTIGDECIICLNNLEKNENATLLKCGHVYHTQCIYGWFLKKKVCPICDIPIEIK